MSKQTLGFAAALLLAIPLSAQQATTPPPTAQPPSKPADAPPRGQPVNIKIDLTISDRTGPGEPAKRTLSMIVADRHVGNIRSSGNVVNARLFVDASPTILSNGDVQLSLGLEYNPRQALTDKVPDTPGVIRTEVPSGGSSLNQRISMVMQSGKPMVISQSADPISDRSITVEVRATVMK